MDIAIEFKKTNVTLNEINYQNDAFVKESPRVSG